MTSSSLPAAPVPSPRGPIRWLGLAYAAGGYLAFVAVFGYAIGFFADLGVPRGVDDGAGDGTGGPALAAALTDAGLLALFAVQHSVMARPWFKRAWTRLVPQPLERATYVWCASLALALVFWGWRPIGGTVWHVTGIGAGVLLTGYAAGWLVAVTSTFLVDHADLFGLRQARRAARGIPYTAPVFTERSLYRWVRHPLMAGLLLAFWCSPQLSTGHLLFALGSTGYVGLGLALEEHDLQQQFGAAYTAYRSRVPALLPLRGRPAGPAGSKR